MKPKKIRVKCKRCGYPHYKRVDELKLASWTSRICQCGEIIRFIPREFVGNNRGGIHE